MVEALAGIIVVVLGIVAVTAVWAAALALFTILASGIYWLFAWPYYVYCWWRERRDARERLEAWRAAEIQKHFAHETHIQNGPQAW